MITGQRVLSAIRLDNQARIEAGKIDDIWRYRKLSAKTLPELFLAEHPPQRALRIGGLSTEPLRSHDRAATAAHVELVGQRR